MKSPNCAPLVKQYLPKKKKRLQAAGDEVDFGGRRRGRAIGAVYQCC
jgi:hypothetical protein